MDETLSYFRIMSYLQKQMTADEEAAFYTWVHSSTERKTLYFELKAVYDTAIIKNKHIDTQACWDRLLRKKNQQKRIVLWKRIASYAAVAAAAVALTSIYFGSSRSDAAPQVAAKYISGDGIEANRVILPDGTVVSIGTETQVIPAPDYGKDKRIVHLSGEAFFEVAKDADKPFLVQAGEQTIEALGTSFNVMAYHKAKEIATTLNTGEVRIATAGKAQTVRLQPNQQLVYNKDTRTLKLHKVDAAEYSAWRNGYYRFKEENLRDILERLGSIYGASIHVETTRFDKFQFTGTFYRGQSLKELMEVLRLSVPLNYTIKERDITIK